MIKAVIIDFDDTLSLTEAACFRLENEVLRRMGRPPIDRELYRSTWGMPMHEAMTLRSPGVDPDGFMKIYPIVHEEMVDQGEIDVVSDENMEVLDKLAEQGKELMILTSRTATEVKYL